MTTPHAPHGDPEFMPDDDAPDRASEAWAHPGIADASLADLRAYRRDRTDLAELGEGA